MNVAMDSGMDESSAVRLLTFLSLGSAATRMPMAAMADWVGRRRVVVVVVVVAVVVVVVVVAVVVLVLLHYYYNNYYYYYCYHHCVQ